MKKNFIAVIIAIAIANFCVAQTKITKDSLVKLMCADVCVEIEDLAKDNKKIENLEEALGTPMMNVFMKYMKELKEVYGFEEMNSENGEIVGKDIGECLGQNCPAFAKLLFSNSEATLEMISDKKTKNDKVITGNFVKLTTADISYIEVKTKAGKTEKLYWMEFFEGSDKLTKNPSALLNKKVSVTYIEKEIYKATLKDYVKVKVITGFSIKAA